MAKAGFLTVPMAETDCHAAMPWVDINIDLDAYVCLTLFNTCYTFPSPHPAIYAYTRWPLANANVALWTAPNPPPRARSLH